MLGFLFWFIRNVGFLIGVALLTISISSEFPKDLAVCIMLIGMYIIVKESSDQMGINREDSKESKERGNS